MFIAMNQFAINPGREADFEAAWTNRDSFLHEVPGFVRFALLKGEGAGEYVSHTTWESRAAFDAWTRSEQFRAGHGKSDLTGVLRGHPQVVLYQAVLAQEAPLAPMAG